MTAKPIAVFTGSRAEYGLLKHLIKAIKKNDELSLQLIVSGSHLSKVHGWTLSEIEADGTQASALIPLSLEQTPSLSMAELTSEALSGTANALEELKPDMLIILGDRYEAFAAAAAGHLLGITVVHIHGGETTKGAIDDRLRHAITQLSTLHFTAAECYRKRVIEMGHPEQLVWNVGPMALDGIIKAKVATREEFEEKTGYKFGKRNLLVTYHPETLLSDHGVAGFEAFLKAIKGMECNILFTHPNADTGGDKLLSLMENFVRQNPRRSWTTPSLGQTLYYSALQLFEAMAGNSSSGIIEAPLMEMPVLNIGGRQDGRSRGPGIIDVKSNLKDIEIGLKNVMEKGQRNSWPRPIPERGISPSRKIARTIEEWLNNDSKTATIR